MSGGDWIGAGVCLFAIAAVILGCIAGWRMERPAKDEDGGQDA